MSNETTEIELKYRIEDVASFRKLIDALQHIESMFVQTNNYMDDAKSSLRNAKVMLRAREIAMPFGAPTVLLKPPVTIEAKRRIAKADGLFISEERAQIMQLDDWNDIKNGRDPMPTGGHLFRWLADVTEFGPLGVIGATVNHRRGVRTGKYLLELDRTKFPDGTEELEVECETNTPDEARKHIEALFSELGVNWAPQQEGKYARFLAKMGL